MTIKAHCMGMPFPKRDTDSPNVKWVEIDRFYERCFRPAFDEVSQLPSEADLDEVAEEQRVKEKTS